METDQSTDHAPRIEPAVGRPKPRQSVRVTGKEPRRPITVTEVVILGMGVSVALACVFMVFAIVYRLQIGPGMGVAPHVAGDPNLSTTEVLSTLVPTFTPTPLPTQTPLALAATPSDLSTPVPEPTLSVSTSVVPPPASSPPSRLVIPKISLDIPVLTVGTKAKSAGGKSELVWADVPNAGGFHQTSAYPGNPGNTVINGHRDMQGAVFRHLNKMAVGDEIVLYVGDMAYSYYVVETVVVPETFASAERRAKNLRYIGYMPEERVTLVTCTPIGLATHRLLVIAKPPDQIVPQMPEAGSESAP
jgi:LPXTG-site transpeptidase (sortase) family protein